MVCDLFLLTVHCFSAGVPLLLHISHFRTAPISTVSIECSHQFTWPPPTFPYRRGNGQSPIQAALIATLKLNWVDTRPQGGGHFSTISHQLNINVCAFLNCVLFSFFCWICSMFLQLTICTWPAEGQLSSMARLMKGASQDTCFLFKPGLFLFYIPSKDLLTMDFSFSFKACILVPTCIWSRRNATVKTFGSGENGGGMVLG